MKQTKVQKNFNLSNQKIKDKDKILKVTREKWQHKREFSSGYQLISQQKLYKPEGNDTVC